jgi:hypothetical protein
MEVFRHETGVPLTSIKQWFDESKGEKILMWLDFRHSGGILARSVRAETVDAETLLSRSLQVVQGKGKVIMCACTADQFAYEDPSSHGHFTRYLLEGLKGGAANARGEVTANSLHDFVDSSMGSSRQRPMFFGTQTGRIVLMHSRSFDAGKSPELPETTSLPEVVTESGSWVVLGNFYFESSKVSNSGGQIVVDIRSKNSDEDAQIQSLAPARYSRPTIPFAHRNDAVIARVTDISSENEAGSQIWRMALRPEEMTYGGGAMTEMACREGERDYSADQIAEMRARLLLLDEWIAERKSGGWGEFSMLELLIEGHSNPYVVKQGLFPDLYQNLRDDQTVFLQVARLFAIYALKASQVFEHVLELNLGPIKNDQLTVYCRGKRQKVYSNVAAKEFQISGECPLHPPKPAEGK